ncbi:uncharacterized protein TNCV_210641 [Trichonephila clavipes]|uniref:Uncharacterized protein n=1 Tax=Trichonephila clavipes TaxID=2585209 RepID=A0A8X6SUS8_TRICX|nr:uncharacterized protein TNCV_210641 [Trichonephila clavipes]
MEFNDRTALSKQLAAIWATTTGVIMSAFSIRRSLLHRGLRARVPLYSPPYHGKPSISASAMSSRSNLLRIEQADAYAEPVATNSNRFIREVLQPYVILFLSGIPGAIFQQDNARSHGAMTVFETSAILNTLNFFHGLITRQICRLFSICGVW